jgi:hypothetical protein
MGQTISDRLQKRLAVGQLATGAILAVEVAYDGIGDSEHGLVGHKQVSSSKLGGRSKNWGPSQHPDYSGRSFFEPKFGGVLIYRSN